MEKESTLIAGFALWENVRGGTITTNEPEILEMLVLEGYKPFIINPKRGLNNVHVPVDVMHRIFNFTLGLDSVRR
jgi:hypothetical protein